MADFQKLVEEYKSENIKVIAGSVDSADKTREMMSKWSITLSIAINLDAEEIARLTGAFYHKDKKFIQPCCFLLRPDGTVETSTYSSGPLGRFLAKHSLNMIRGLKKKK